jgi:hypothetical protein
MMGHSSHRTWEYTTLSDQFAGKLDSLGAAGWEVVSAPNDQGAGYLLKRTALTFQEQVTLDQRKRYFAMWGIDVEDIDRDSVT